MVALALGLCVACKSPRPTPPRFDPPIDDTLVPDVLAGLVVDDSRFGDADLDGAFVRRDIRLGGRSAVGWNGRPAIAVVRDVPDADGYVVRSVSTWAPIGPPPEPDELPLAAVQVTIDPSAGPSVCEWADTTLGTIEATSDCSDAHREPLRTHARSTWCLGSPDRTRAIAVTCERGDGLDGQPREQIRYERITLR